MRLKFFRQAGLNIIARRRVRKELKRIRLEFVKLKEIYDLCNHEKRGGVETHVIQPTIKKASDFLVTDAELEERRLGFIEFHLIEAIDRMELNSLASMIEILQEMDEKSVEALMEINKSNALKWISDGKTIKKLVIFTSIVIEAAATFSGGMPFHAGFIIAGITALWLVSEPFIIKRRLELNKGENKKADKTEKSENE